MKESRILDAIGELPEDLLAPVEKLRQRKRRPWVRWLSLAACLCLLISLPVMWIGVNGGVSEKSDAENVQELPEKAEGWKDFPLYSADMVYGECGGSSAVFHARVLEVCSGTSLLAEPLEGEAELLCSDKIEIVIQGVDSVPELQVGDIVEIRYDGMIQEIYPARISTVVSIRVIE